MKRETLPFIALFAVVFGVCYTTTSWIASRYASLPAWDFSFEALVPFVPGASLLYLTITPVLLLAPFVLRERKELAPFALTLCAETLVASACFLLFPQTVAWSRPPVTGWAHLPFTIADALNLSYNQFPSLHVAFACSAGWAYSANKHRLWWMLWAFAVAASTWLMWEHHLVDIVGGVALAAGAMALLHARLRNPGVELQCLWQCARFSRRHVRYFVIFLAVWLPSLLHWRRYRAVRVGFCTAQWIDDLLDGDRPSPREPLEVIDELLAQMERREFSSQPLSRLTAALFDELDSRAQRDFMALVRCMRRDRERVLAGAVWSEAELDAHHHATFSLSVDMMLATAGCAARAEQVPSLIHAFGWCSVFRDLDDDLRKGLNNIPRDVETEAWILDSRNRAVASLRESGREIARLDDPRARRILAVFQRSIEKFASRSVAVTVPSCPAVLPAGDHPLGPAPVPTVIVHGTELPPHAG